MELLGGILLVGLGLIGALLIAPLVLVIDTTRQRYTLQWRGVAEVRLLPDGHVRLWVLGWTNVINPWTPRTRSAKQRRDPKATRRRWSYRLLARSLRDLLRSFRVRYLEVDLDTDDYVLNAYLYALSGLLNRPGQRFRINFQGVCAVRLRIDNRPYRLLWMVIQFVSLQLLPSWQRHFKNPSAASRTFSARRPRPIRSWANPSS